MAINRKLNIIKEGKSPSVEAMKRVYNKAISNGGITVDFDENIENIRELSRKLGYNVLQDTTLLYVPSSYSEGKNFVQNPSIRNLFQRSEEFNNGYWSKFNTAVITPDAVVSPDGNTTADLMSYTAGTTNPQIAKTFNTEIGKYYTASIYIKSSGVIGSPVALVATGTAASTVSLTNNWVRFTYTFIATTTSTSFSHYRTGSAGGSHYIWGAQLEQSPISTSYQRTTDGIADFTFTRATSSTVTNKQGVIEDSCYNLLQFSETMSNGAWVPFQCTQTINTNLNPFNSNKSYYLTDNTSLNSHNLLQSYNFTIGVTYTFTFYVKKADDTWCQFLLGFNAFGSAGSTKWKNFNFDTGLFGNGGGGTWSAKQIANGYWEITVTATCILSGTNAGPAIFGTNNTDTVSPGAAYVGSNRKFCDIAAVQMLIGSTPRPYLKTTNRLNVPRLDYSRTLLEPSLLIEPQRTNNALWSQDFTNVYWVKTNTTVQVTAVLAPDGILTANKLVETASNTQHYIVHDNIPLAAGLCTVSLYVKAAERTIFDVYMSDTSTSVVNLHCNLSTLTSSISVLAGSAWTSTSSTLSNVGNDWYRITFTGNKTTGFVSVRYFLSTGAVTGTYVGDGTSGLYIWGIQIEAGLNATTYIPTTTTTITRNSETAYVDLWNNNLLNKDSFTLLVEGYLYSVGSTNSVIALSDTTRTGLYSNDLGILCTFAGFIAESGSLTIIGSSLPNNSFFKIVIVSTGGVIKFYRNGTLMGNASGAIFNYRYLSVNSTDSTYSVDKIALFNRALSDLEAINLSSPTINLFAELANLYNYTLIT